MILVGMILATLKNDDAEDGGEEAKKLLRAEDVKRATSAEQQLTSRIVGIIKRN